MCTGVRLIYATTPSPEPLPQSCHDPQPQSLRGPSPVPASPPLPWSCRDCKLTANWKHCNGTRAAALPAPTSSGASPSSLHTKLASSCPYFLLLLLWPSLNCGSAHQSCRSSDATGQGFDFRRQGEPVALLHAPAGTSHAKNEGEPTALLHAAADTPHTKKFLVW